MRRRQIAIQLLTVGALLSPAALIFWLAAARIANRPPAPPTFEEAWSTYDKIPFGMSRDYVIRALGPPSYRSPHPDLALYERQMAEITSQTTGLSAVSPTWCTWQDPDRVGRWISICFWFEPVWKFRKEPGKPLLWNSRWEDRGKRPVHRRLVDERARVIS